MLSIIFITLLAVVAHCYNITDLNEVKACLGESVEKYSIYLDGNDMLQLDSIDETELHITGDDRVAFECIEKYLWLGGAGFGPLSDDSEDVFRAHFTLENRQRLGMPRISDLTSDINNIQQSFNLEHGSNMYQ